MFRFLLGTLDGQYNDQLQTGEIKMQMFVDSSFLFGLLVEVFV